jgi:hypothetical protein
MSFPLVLFFRLQFPRFSTIFCDDWLLLHALGIFFIENDAKLSCFKILRTAKLSWWKMVSCWERLDAHELVDNAAHWMARGPCGTCAGPPTPHSTLQFLFSDSLDTLPWRNPPPHAAPIKSRPRNRAAPSSSSPPSFRRHRPHSLLQLPCPSDDQQRRRREPESEEPMKPTPSQRRRGPRVALLALVLCSLLVPLAFIFDRAPSGTSPLRLASLPPAVAPLRGSANAARMRAPPVDLGVRFRPVVLNY